MLKRVVCVIVVVGFAFAAYAQKIYWAETFYEGTQPPYNVHHKILRADPDGSNVEDAVDTSPYPPDGKGELSYRGRTLHCNEPRVLPRAGRLVLRHAAAVPTLDLRAN